MQGMIFAALLSALFVMGNVALFSLNNGTLDVPGYAAIALINAWAVVMALILLHIRRL